MGKPVRVRDAPGLVWKKRANDIWEARWQCRTDVVAKGFTIKSVKVWSGAGDPTKEQWDFIADTCSSLQQEMRVFGRGWADASVAYDGTLASLMLCYKNDADSNFKKLRYNSRCYYEVLMGLIERDYGTELLIGLKARTFLRWHEAWTEGGKIAAGHGKIGMLRTLFSYGATMLENEDCARLSGVLSKQRFEMPKSRLERLTADQVVAIRAKAHELGKASIALAQAFQFELMLRQKDVIGEWVPMAEPGMSDVFAGRRYKWLRGIRWEEIDQNMILTHVTSKRQKEIVINLKNAPMVMEELRLEFGIPVARDVLPDSGPVIIDERDCLPWDAYEFRRHWRILADACSIPKTVRNMDSRAGGISEATDAGADLEHVRHAATHSNISMTQRYSRGSEGKIANVQKLRADSRNKPKTE